MVQYTFTMTSFMTVDTVFGALETSLVSLQLLGGL